MSNPAAAAATPTEPASAPPRAKKRAVKVLIKLALVAAMAVFWVIFVRKGLADLGKAHWHLEWRPALTACAAFTAASVLFGVLWSPMCREISGVRLGPLLAFRASMIAWIARYVPGKVWSVAAKAYYSCPTRAQAGPVAIALTIETLWFELSGLLLAAIILPWYPGLHLPGNLRLASVGFIAASFLFAYPPIFCRLCNLGLRLLRQPPLPCRPRYRVLLALTLGYMAVFALFSAGFIALARGVAPVRLTDAPLLIGAYTAAWVAGFLAFLMPNGLGARETALAGMLSISSIPPAAIVTLVLAARVLGTIVEVICALVAVTLPFFGLAREAQPVQQSGSHP